MTSSNPPYPTGVTPPNRRLTSFKGHNGKPILENSIILIPFMDLITAGVARRIKSKQIAAVFHLVLEFRVKSVKPAEKASNKGIMKLVPMHFGWDTNPIKCGSSLLVGVISSLQEEEVILKKGTLKALSERFDVPELGDIVFQLLKQSSLFKSREDGDILNDESVVRDIMIFPTQEGLITPLPKKSKATEGDLDAPDTGDSSISSLSMASTNDASARLLAAIKSSPTRVSNQLKDLVRAQVFNQLNAWIKSVNPNFDPSSSSRPMDYGDDNEFVGRGPPPLRRSKRLLAKRSSIDSLPMNAAIKNLTHFREIPLIPFPKMLTIIRKTVTDLMTNTYGSTTALIFLW